MNDKVSAFVHIEVVHPDPDAAARFMAETLGAEQVEQNLTAYFEEQTPGIRVVHMRIGNVPFRSSNRLPCSTPGKSS